MSGKRIVIIAILIILIIAVLGFFTWNMWLSELFLKVKTQTELMERQKELAKSIDARIANKISESQTETSENQDIIINSPKAGELISSPLIITGQVNGNGWSGFEGQVGTVILLDENTKVLGTAILEPATDWMRLPTKFKATLTFVSAKEQNGKLVFKNENPSGMPENNMEFSLPVKISKGQ